MYLHNLRCLHALLADLSSADDRSYFTLAKRHSPILVDNARDAGYITVSSLNICRLTPAGQQHLAHLTQFLASAQQQSQQLCEQHAQQKRTAISDRRFQLFLTLLSFALGMLAEHFSGILDFLSALLH